MGCFQSGSGIWVMHCSEPVNAMFLWVSILCICTCSSLSFCAGCGDMCALAGHTHNICIYTLTSIFRCLHSYLCYVLISMSLTMLAGHHPPQPQHPLPRQTLQAAQKAKAVHMALQRKAR